MGPPAPGAKAQSAVNFFSVWCPKVIAQIGHLPDTLADRSIIFRMQRKIPTEQCQRIRNLNTLDLRRQCARFVLDHSPAITNARPEIPKSLNDRAADIWEPLLALADLAGGDWPRLARDAAVGLAGSAEETNPISSLLLDIFITFCVAEIDRIFSRDLVDNLAPPFPHIPAHGTNTPAAARFKNSFCCSGLSLTMPQPLSG
jgi:putative DNA primase/helicase